LFAEGATLPFVARYRKEVTGNLDEVKLEAISERAAYLAELDARKETVRKEIEGQGKLTPELAARIESFELAYRMQMAAPEAIDIARETPATHQLYGLDNPKCTHFAKQCLIARRLVERGVRFVQVFHGSNGGAGAWDAHGGLRANHSSLCAQVDKPIAGLIQDLKQRGLLKDTLVVWGTEFGRTPGAQGADGRDHHPYGFSIWLAGAGVKGGVAHGATDELGFHAVENRHYVTDLHATVLHLLGLDSHKLEVPGRKRLDIDHGHVIKDILA